MIADTTFIGATSIVVLTTESGEDSYCTIVQCYRYRYFNHAIRCEQRGKLGRKICPEILIGRTELCASRIKRVLGSHKKIGEEYDIPLKKLSMPAFPSLAVEKVLKFPKERFATGDFETKKIIFKAGSNC